MSGAGGPVRSSMLKQMVRPIRLSHIFDEIEDGPRLVTGPSAVALPALPVITPLVLSSLPYLNRTDTTD